MIGNDLLIERLSDNMKGVLTFGNLRNNKQLTEIKIIFQDLSILHSGATTPQDLIDNPEDFDFDSCIDQYIKNYNDNSWDKDKIKLIRLYM